LGVEIRGFSGHIERYLRKQSQEYDEVHVDIIDEDDGAKSIDNPVLGPDGKPINYDVLPATSES